MPKPTKGPRIGSSPKHERTIMHGLASQLFVHGKIKTTAVRAKRVQPIAEQLITKAKRGDLHSRRLVLKDITDPSVVHILFTEIAPMMEEREGGYTRVTRVGNRKGDNAPMAVIELVTEKVEPKPKAKKAEKVEEPEEATEAKLEEAEVEESAVEAEDEVVEAEAEEDEAVEAEAEAVEAEEADEAEVDEAEKA